MENGVQDSDRWEVLATSSRVDLRTRVLKHGESFGLFDAYGDIRHLGASEQGLYHHGTRFLSKLELRINDQRALLLNSTVKEDNSLLVADLTTPDLGERDHVHIRKGTLHVFRAKLLHAAVLHERLRIVNYGHDEARLHVELRFGADFADIFEVRGVERPRRGERLPERREAGALFLGYRGLDGVVRTTRIDFDPQPDGLDGAGARFSFRLAPRAERDLYVTVSCEIDAYAPERLHYEQALTRVESEITEARSHSGRLYASNEQFNDWLNRSAADMRMLTTQTTQGNYPYAGVPWFSTAFGRDGVIAALQMLWLDPSIARGVLGFLAAHQADAVDPVRDAEPGKILHEVRYGEMAALGEVPFGRYYGSVDSTPLFVLLAGEYYERTGDRDFIDSIRGSIDRALEWIDTYGDADGDGFVEYARHSANGLVNQGWKDSEDAVFHADGRDAEAPIALCEVQGYVYAAKRAAARLAAARGDDARARELEEAAGALKERFNRAFWCEETGNYALALDGAKRPCCVQASNAGHALYTGIASDGYAPRVAELLLSEAFFSGWGVRTLAHGERRYNPMSYHNGSIWPHDNGLIALGLGRYGGQSLALKILTGLFDASIALELHRLPELFCGFERMAGQGPTLYPVACSPQAWASGAVFHLLQACLGLSFCADKPQLRFVHPVLPDWLQWIEARDLEVGAGRVDLAIHRHAHDVGIHVLRKDGDIEVAVIV